MKSNAFRLLDIAEVRYHEPMKNHTTMKVGGLADVFIIPNKTMYIREIIDICKALMLPVQIIGNGSNLIVSDRGIRGAVVKIGKTCGRVVVKGTTIRAEAGVSISKLIKVGIANNLKGLEIITGIPGSLGGAIYMNASYTRPIANIIKSVTVLRNSEVVVLSRAELLFTHRKSVFHSNDDIILSAELELKEGHMAAEVQNYQINRKFKQPLHLPSCGSVFKKAPTSIKKLKGIAVNDAEFNKGFILNKGNATATDVCEVIKIVRSKSKGFLKLEAELIGDFK